MNKRKIFSRVSSLVSSGQHKIAIDLLLEYLEVEPNSSIILSLLDRAYTLDNQPEKAVIYQIRSIEIKKPQHTKKTNPTRYIFDDYSDDDMAFTKSQVKNNFEEDYIFDVDATPQPPVKKETKIGRYSKPSLSIGTTEHNEIKFENNIKSDSKSRHKNTIGVVNGNAIAEEKNRLPYPNNSFVEITAPDLTLDNGAAKQPSINENHNSDWLEFDDFDLIEKEPLLSDELFEGDNDDQDEEVHDELVHPSFYSQEEVFEDLILDDFEGLDEFDEFAHREVEEEALGDGKISREIRARQIAVEVLDKSGWNPKHLLLLQKIFIENGWSATRRSIEREIDKNLQPEELALARKIRLFWLGNERYWMTFQKIKHNAKFQQTDATYKCMSWPESLRIIRCFPSPPDIEEIYIFIDETFEHWYNSNRLRRSFKAFFKFLKYRTGSLHRTLPGDCMFSFYPVNIDTGIDSNMFCIPVTPVSQELMELGFQLNQWPRAPENKVKIIKEAK